MVRRMVALVAEIDGHCAKAELPKDAAKIIAKIRRLVADFPAIVEHADNLKRGKFNVDRIAATGMPQLVPELNGANETTPVCKPTWW